MENKNAQLRINVKYEDSPHSHRKLCQVPQQRKYAISKDNDPINHEQPHDHNLKRQIRFLKESESNDRQPRAKRFSSKHYQIQRIIKYKISERIIDMSNKALFPVLMGPHPIYTVQMDKSCTTELQSVDLREKLIWWLKLYSHQKCLLKQIKKSSISIKLQQGELEKAENKSIKNRNVKKINSRIGSKYNKYSLQLKKSIVKRIQEKLEQEKPNQKSLRYYVLQQAKALKIHPKNIIRWFDTADLDRNEGGRKAKHPVLQYRLAMFLKQNQNCKRRQIIQEAKKILAELGGDDDFNFSKGWYERFKNRVKDDKVSRSIQAIQIQDLKNYNPQSKISVRVALKTKIDSQSEIYYSEEQQERGNIKNQCKLQENEEKCIKVQNQNVE